MVSLTVPIAFLVGGGGSPTLIGFFGDVSFFGPGIALVGGLILTGTIFSGHLKFHEVNKVKSGICCCLLQPGDFLWKKGTI